MNLIWKPSIFKKISLYSFYPVESPWKRQSDIVDLGDYSSRRWDGLGSQFGNDNTRKAETEWDRRDEEVAGALNSLDIVFSAFEAVDVGGINILLQEIFNYPYDNSQMISPKRDNDIFFI